VQPLPAGLPAVSVHGGSADLQVRQQHVLQGSMAWRLHREQLSQLLARDMLSCNHVRH
jgi:hypothetical protein